MALRGTLANKAAASKSYAENPISEYNSGSDLSEYNPDSDNNKNNSSNTPDATP